MAGRMLSQQEFYLTREQLSGIIGAPVHIPATVGEPLVKVIEGQTPADILENLVLKFSMCDHC